MSLCQFYLVKTVFREGCGAFHTLLSYKDFKYINTMSFISIISQFLYYRTIPEHEEIKKQLMPKILEQEEKFKNNNIGIENAYTSYSIDKDWCENNSLLTEPSVVKPVV